MTVLKEYLTLDKGKAMHAVKQLGFFLQICLCAEIKHLPNRVIQVNWVIQVAFCPRKKMKGRKKIIIVIVRQEVEGQIKLHDCCMTA